MKNKTRLEIMFLNQLVKEHFDVFDTLSEYYQEWKSEMREEGRKFDSELLHEQFWSDIKYDANTRIEYALKRGCSAENIISAFNVNYIDEERIYDIYAFLQEYPDAIRYTSQKQEEYSDIPEKDLEYDPECYPVEWYDDIGEEGRCKVRKRRIVSLAQDVKHGLFFIT